MMLQKKIINELMVQIRGVYQTTQTAKIAPKPPAKWHNRTTPQVIVHRTTSNSAPHHTKPHGAVRFAVL